MALDLARQRATDRAYYEAHREQILERKRVRARARYAENPEKYRAQGRAYHAAHREERQAKTRAWNAKYPTRMKERDAGHRKIIQAIKVQSGCVDCGNKDYRVLDFDHVRGTKLFSLHSAHRALKSIYAEIEKCEVRCANCHRIQTYERRQAVA